MRFKNSRRWVRQRGSVAALHSAAILLAAFGLRWFVQDWIAPYAPLHFFSIACFVIAYRYGYLLALGALVLGAVLGTYFFIPPYDSFGGLTFSDIIELLTFISVTGFAIAYVEKLQRTVYSQKLLLKVMNDQHRAFLFQKNELLDKLRKAQGGRSR